MNFKELIKRGSSLNEIWMMEKLKAGIDVSAFLSSPREKALLTGMMKRLLITEECKITKIGEEILALNDAEGEEMVVVPVEKIEGFNEWWTVFPQSSYFEHKGRVFKGTRKLTNGKAKCKEIFDRYIKLKLFTAEEIIRGTAYHIETAKELSVRKGENQLTYIPNSERYLREKYFEAYIKPSLKGKKENSGYTTEG